MPELFQSIRDLYAPFTIAALPIGAYEPPSIFKPLHMNPTEAIQAHHDLGSPCISIGIHWGTFHLSNENYLSPPELLARLWAAQNTNGSQFITASLGQLIDIE